MNKFPLNIVDHHSELHDPSFHSKYSSIITLFKIWERFISLFGIEQGFGKDSLLGLAIW